MASRHIACTCRVNRPQMSDALAVFRVLPNADKNLVIVNNGCGNNRIARAAPAQLPHSIFWVAVKFPNQVASFGLHCINPAIASGANHLWLPIDNAISGIGPLPVQDIFGGISFFPHQFTRIEIDRNKAGRQRRRNGDMAFVNTIGSDDKQKIPRPHGRTGRQIVRKHIQLFHHVVFPDNIHADVACILFPGVWTIIFPIQKTLCIRAHHATLIGDIIHPIPANIRRGANTLLWPIIDAPRGQLGMRCLPEKFSIGFLKSHNHALVTRDFGVARDLIICTHEYFPAYPDGTGVGLRAKICFPGDIFTCFCIPVRRQIFCV